MSKITDISIQKNKERANLFLDEKFFCGLSCETIVKSGLKIGQDIEKEELEKIQLESEGKRCFEAALKLLERRPYSETKIKTKLKEKGYLDDTIVESIKKLKEYHYLDDFALANTIVKSYKGKSKKELQQKLFSYGIYGKAQEEVLCELNEISEETACKAAAEKHAKRKEKTKENMIKTMKYLVTKGFSFGLAKRQASQIYNIEGEEDD